METSHDLTLGVLFAVLAALGFALWNIFLQRALERGASPRLALFTMALCLSAPMLPLSLALGWAGELPPLTLSGTIYLVLAGVLTAAVAPFHSAQATRRIGAAQTTALRLLDPLWAFVIALLFLGDRFVLQVVFGVALIMAALGLLQLERRGGGESVPGARVSGILWAVGASVLFTVGSTMRKVGMTDIPSAVLSTTVEGLTGLALVLPSVLMNGEAGQAFARGRRDLWFAGLASSCATLFINMALQRLSVPVAVALRNTSPWFALALVPLLLGARFKPGRWVWASTFLLTGGMLLILLR